MQYINIVSGIYCVKNAVYMQKSRTVTAIYIYIYSLKKLHCVMMYFSDWN
jgi:hypothetical protein